MANHIETTQNENDELRIANAAIVEKCNQLALRMGLLPTDLQDQLQDVVLEGATERLKDPANNYQKKTKVRLSTLGTDIASLCFTTTIDVAQHVTDNVTAAKWRGFLTMNLCCFTPARLK
jgi:hypothetical protein